MKKKGKEKKERKKAKAKRNNEPKKSKNRNYQIPISAINIKPANAYNLIFSPPIISYKQTDTVYLSVMP